MELSIQQVAAAAGTTSRTLRHYDELGLLAPSRVGPNGYRYYDRHALVRLQRILLLRELGLGLAVIADVLDHEPEPAQALRTHLGWLRQEQARLARQVAAVESTITTLENGADLMTTEMFDGFDHTRYREEVEQRWGADAYARSDTWWRDLGPQGQRDWRAAADRLGHDWTAAWRSGVSPTDPAAQELAARHVDWLRGVPGTPAADPEGDLAAYLTGLADMYVSDERFAANYGGPDGARFVRDALHAYAAAQL